MAHLKKVKHAVAVLIPAASAAAETVFLAVKRPVDDPELPGTWGLPAATLGEEESWEDAARRVGESKLGVELGKLEELREGTLERSDYLLHMKLFAGRITAGTPKLTRKGLDVTLYADWRWGTAADLEEGALRGSLCCRLCLQELGRQEGAEAS